jgi:hypothetical protein
MSVGNFVSISEPSSLGTSPRGEDTNRTFTGVLTKPLGPLPP